MVFKLIPLRFSILNEFKDKKTIIVIDNVMLFTFFMPKPARSIISEVFRWNLYEGKITIKDVEEELYKIQLDEYLGPITYTR